MNYIKQIRFFWDKAKRHSLGAGEIAMYFYLLECSNVHNWENPVIEPNATLQHAIGVKSYNTLKELRNRLQQSGLLRFKTKNGSGLVEYDLFNADKQTFSKNAKVAAKVIDEVTDEVAAKVPDKVEAEHLLYNKHKPKQKVILARSDAAYDLNYFTGLGFDFFGSDALLQALDDFLKYRAAHPVHRAVVSGQQVEAILGGFIAREISDADAIECIRFTIEKGAKNVIYELPKKPTHEREKHNNTGRKGHDTTAIVSAADSILQQYQSGQYTGSDTEPW